MIQKILCLLGCHDWVYTDTKVQLGTERVCRGCGQKELFTHELTSSICFWLRIR